MNIYILTIKREDHKMELIKINKKILHITLECFEKAFQTPEILSHNLEKIKNLIEKFFEITLYLRKTLEVNFSFLLNLVLLR